MTLGSIGRHMCQGEFESLKEIYNVSPEFVPRPYAWGRYSQPGPETYFLLAEFKEIGLQVSKLKILYADLSKSTLDYNIQCLSRALRKHTGHLLSFGFSCRTLLDTID